MLITSQFYKIFYYIFLLPSFIFCIEQYSLRWGELSLQNNSLNLQSKYIISVINNQMQYLNSLFNNIKSSPFEIIILNNQNSQSFNNDIWEWSLGITKGNKIFIKDPSVSHISKNKFEKVLRHEINHLFLNRLKNSSKIPRWFEEGFSMQYANENSISKTLLLANHINDEDLFNISKLDEKFYSNKRMFNFAYAYSNALVANIISLYSDITIYQIILRVSNGELFSDAFYNSTLISLEEFNKSVFNNIKIKYRWFKFIKFPNFLLILAPILLWLGFMIKKRKNNQKIKEWEIEDELERLQDEL